MFDSTASGSTFFEFSEARQTPSVVSVSNSKHHAVFGQRRGADGGAKVRLILHCQQRCHFIPDTDLQKKEVANKSTEINQIKSDAPLSEP